MKNSILIPLLSLSLYGFSWAAPSIPFSGKLAVDGKNFHGTALFAFSLVDGEGAVHWKHAQENNATIENFVLNGRYLVLLGGQGMQTLPANLFLENDNLFLRVRVDLQDGQGIRLLEPDQPITSTPYALAAELARLAEKAEIAGGVDEGAITAGMIDAELLADLNKTITISDLPEEVVESMNRPITREMLPQDVRDDLNRTILRHHLSEELRADLNRTITKRMLSQEIKDDLNRTIGVSQLSAEVNEKLNRDFTIQPGSISKSLLGQDVLGDLNRTILRHHLSEELRAELNRTIRLRDLAPEVIADLNDSIAPGSITLDMLASGVRADLNRTVRLQDLSPEVSQSINRSITLSDLDSQVITELNNSIAPGSISLDQLSQQVRNDLNATITRARLSQDVRDELNATITRDRLSSDLLADLNRTEVADGSVTASKMASNTITTNQLSEQILKYLKPEVVRSPALPQDREQFYAGQSVTLSADAEGKYLTYQWLRNGQEISGATNKEFTITDANATLHNGNYSVRISNDFGHVSTTSVQLDVNDSLLIHEANLNASVALEMIWVEPGTFTMGQDGVATPVHEVTLTQGFYLGKYEVTQAQYEAVMTGNTDGLSATPSQWPNNPDRPVEQVSWDDIQKFLTRLNAQQAGNISEGWAYVLPTEAQWEYACRAGTTTAYSWGATIASSNANYNWDGGANDGNDFKQTRDVGLYDANPWGFFDMHGNVAEWTADWYAAYSSGAQNDPEGPATGSSRVFRGGSWSSTGPSLRSASRNYNSPSLRFHSIGFRVGFQQVPADVASPEMSILGDANITQLQGVAWVDPGVEAHDVRDGNLSDDVTVSGTVDVNTTGTYTLTYTVSDAAGNQASLTRTVNVGTPATYTSDLNASVALKMIWVEPGTFTMGQNDISSASPEHNVTLTAGFYLGKYEVTQAQYEAVMTGNTDGLSATPSQWPNNPDRPVEKVSWDDIQKFLTRLNAQQAGNIPEGWAYVLPTEAQWEYACRAGTTTAYSWGDSISASDANWNHGADANQTENVGQYSANPWGFFDMHGNVWEWTADAYANYATGAQTDPFNVGTSVSGRVVRGGSWGDTGAGLRSAYRFSSGPSYRNNSLGFRVGFQQVPADVASPEMSILGDANITQLQGVAWVDPGVEAHDVRDGNLTSSVTVSGTVDVNTTGTYTLTYTVSDAAGNQASLTRTVNIVEGQASTHTADLNASVALEMIWVEPGTFTMGQSDISNASPEHNVTLTQGFYLGKYEVTQAQYEAVITGNTDGLSATPSQWPNNPDRPVEKVSWEDIQVFLTRLNAQQAGNIPEGWAYVLPTEAQWEYACRAGTTTAYSWGDSISASDANWNHGADANQTENVGQYSANPWGFFDMHGNVWEWTADWYAAYSSGAQTDPEGPAAGSSRVVRGGSWLNPGAILRSASRGSSYPGSRNYSIGFRVGFQQQ